MIIIALALSVIVPENTFSKLNDELHICIFIFEQDPPK